MGVFQPLTDANNRLTNINFGQAAYWQLNAGARK